MSRREWVKESKVSSAVFHRNYLIAARSCAEGVLANGKIELTH